MKRDELLSTVPMSISVLSADRMSESGISDIRGVAAVSAGVEYDFSSQFGPGILTDIAIRGISAQKGGATTGLYIDDTPIQMPHSVFNNPYALTFDLARVEVLRGPQGVLFGRSAEGGAVRFVTNEPSTTTTSELYHSEVSVTEHGAPNYEAGAAAGGPLIADVLGARISAWYRHDGGYVDRIDPFTGATVDADANHSASELLRLDFAFEPDDRFRIVPGFTYQSISLHDTPTFYANQSASAIGVLDNGKLLDQPSIDEFRMGSVRMTARLGGANLTVVTSYFDRTAAAPLTYAPDSVWSFELGAKNQLLGSRLQLNASIFDIRWPGVQVYVYDACGHGLTTNAGEARSTGFDLDMEAMVSERLRVTLALGMLDTLTARYDWPLVHEAKAFVRMEEIVHSHNPGPFSEQDPDNTNYNPSLRADPATDLLNLQLGVRWGNSDIRLFVDNAFDSRPELQRDVDVPGSPLVYAYTFKPRTAGVRANWRF